MDFQKFKEAVNKQFAEMLKTGQLFSVKADPDKVYELYIASFPQGTNPMFRERTEHECTCCRQFIKQIGHVVAIKDNKPISIWDIDPKGVDEGYVVVAKALAEHVKAFEIDGPWLHFESKVGTTHTIEQLLDGKMKKWDHFHVNVPLKFTRPNKDIASEIGTKKNSFLVLQNGLTKLRYSDLEVMMELLAVKGTIYRGEEMLPLVTEFAKVMKEFKALPKEQQTYFVWDSLAHIPASTIGFKNTSIGGMAEDLSKDMDLERAIDRFESKVAPTNYKRTSAAVTPRMVEDAKKTVKQEGYEASLQRRHATKDDIPVANILFADRGANAVLASEDPFNNLATAKVVVSEKIQSVALDNFLKEILPTAQTVEVLLEGKLRKNVMTLVAPVNATAPSMFAWDNAISWSYMDGVTSAIRDRVKKEGGAVEGDLCCRLAWDYIDDLDFYMREPNGHIIYFGTRGTQSPNGGKLDVDANGGSGMMQYPVENIVYADSNDMQDGVYELYVKNYHRRQTQKQGFIVELDFNGSLITIDYDKAVRENETVTVAKLKVTAGKIELVQSLDSKETRKNINGLDSGQFHKVSMLMKSPNFWDAARGNRHTFFILDGLKMEGPVRGFYNEFLAPKLEKHRKVFEILGGKMLVPDSVDQLTGIGINSTEYESVVVRVTGQNLQRTFRVTSW